MGDICEYALSFTHFSLISRIFVFHLPGSGSSEIKNRSLTAMVVLSSEAVSVRTGALTDGSATGHRPRATGHRPAWRGHGRLSRALNRQQCWQVTGHAWGRRVAEGVRRGGGQMALHWWADLGVGARELAGQSAGWGREAEWAGDHVLHEDTICGPCGLQGFLPRGQSST